MCVGSLIGIQRNDKYVECIYCHSNGNPGHIGRLLLDNYCTNDYMEELISQGDVLCLSDTLSNSVFDNRDKEKSRLSTKARLLPLDIYNQGPSIDQESFRYLLDSEGNLMCYDVYEDVFMNIECYI